MERYVWNNKERVQADPQERYVPEPNRKAELERHDKDGWF